MVVCATEGQLHKSQVVLWKMKIGGGVGRVYVKVDELDLGHWPVVHDRLQHGKNNCEHETS